MAIIVLFINIVLYIVLNTVITVIGEKVARCNAVIAMATRNENFNKDILLGSKDILYLKTMFQYSSAHIGVVI